MSHSKHLDPLKLNRKGFETNSDRNVFIIMRYARGTLLDQVKATIKATLAKYDLRAILARDMAFDQEMWGNIKFCMEHSRYGIVVFDRVKRPTFSPNVTLELGYMLALKKPTLILKEQGIRVLSTDIINHLHTSFDPKNAEPSISDAITEWLGKLGHSRIKSAEIITADDALEANKARTRAIICALQGISKAPSDHIIRQAASLSSVAISNKELYQRDSNQEYLKLLLQEQSLMMDLLNGGAKLRLIVSPWLHLSFAEHGLVGHTHIKNNIIPRYDRLISIIKNNIDNHNFQITHTLRLPHDNIIIIDNSITFIGRKKRRETGFPYTTKIFDPAVISEETDEFDEIFNDTVCSTLTTNEAQEEDLFSPRIKQKVIEELSKCKIRLEKFVTS